MLLIGEKKICHSYIWSLTFTQMEIPLNEKYRTTNTVAFIRKNVCQANFLKHSDNLTARVYVHDEIWRILRFKYLWRKPLYGCFSWCVLPQNCTILRVKSRTCEKKKEVSFYASLTLMKTSVCKSKPITVSAIHLECNNLNNMRIFLYIQV